MTFHLPLYLAGALSCGAGPDTLRDLDSLFVYRDGVVVQSMIVAGMEGWPVVVPATVPGTYWLVTSRKNGVRSCESNHLDLTTLGVPPTVAGGRDTSWYDVQGRRVTGKRERGKYWRKAK